MPDRDGLREITLDGQLEGGARHHKHMPDIARATVLDRIEISIAKHVESRSVDYVGRLGIDADTIDAALKDGDQGATRVRQSRQLDLCRERLANTAVAIKLRVGGLRLNDGHGVQPPQRAGRLVEESVGEFALAAPVIRVLDDEDRTPPEAPERVEQPLQSCENHGRVGTLLERLSRDLLEIRDDLRFEHLASGNLKARAQLPPSLRGADHGGVALEGTSLVPGEPRLREIPGSRSSRDARTLPADPPRFQPRSPAAERIPRSACSSPPR